METGMKAAMHHSGCRMGISIGKGKFPLKSLIPRHGLFMPE